MKEQWQREQYGKLWALCVWLTDWIKLVEALIGILTFGRFPYSFQLPFMNWWMSRVEKRRRTDEQGVTTDGQ